MSASPPPTRPGMMEPFRLREFRLLLTGFIVGQSMMPLQFVASIAWIQFVADDSVEIIMVGAIGTIRGLGMIGFGLFGGALADRFDRRRLLMVTQAVAFISNILIAVMMWTGSGTNTDLIIFFGAHVCGLVRPCHRRPDSQRDHPRDSRPAAHPVRESRSTLPRCSSRCRFRSSPPVC